MRSFIVILFICCFNATDRVLSEILQKYEIFDTNEYQSSFLYVGGSLVISCEASGNEKEVQILNRTNGVNVALGQPKPYNELKINLDASYVGHLYGCFPPPNRGGMFTIPELHCNPFDMSPTEICKPGKKCMIEKSGKSKCKAMDENACFLSKFSNIKDEFKDSLTKLSVACVDFDLNSANSKTIYGLCHAQATNKKPVLGLAEEIQQCTTNQFEHFTLNNRTIVQDNLFFETNFDPKTWKLIHKEKLSAECTFTSQNGKVIANFITQDMNSVDPATTSSLQGNILPIKLNVHCNSSNSKDKQSAITTYLVLFDPNPSLYTVTIQKTNSKDGSIVLTCVCNVPVGFQCQLSWSKPDDTSTSLETILSLTPKTIESKERNTVRNETCYLQVWMYNHPAHSGLIKIPLNHEFKKSISIHKQGDKPTGDKNNPSSDKETPNGNSSSLGGGAKDKDDKSSSKSTIIIVVVILICFLIASAVLALAVFWMRKNRKNRGKIILQACAEQPIVVASAEQPKLDTSARQPKLVASAEQPKVIASAEQPKHDETFINEMKKDEKHHVDMITINKLTTKSNEINEAVLLVKRSTGLDDSAAFKAVLEEYPDFKFISIEFSDLVALRKLFKCEEVGFVPTCRYYKQEVLRNTWAFKDQTEAKLLPSKKDPLNAGRFLPAEEIFNKIESGNPLSLNCSQITDIYCQKSYLLCQAPKLSEMVLLLNTLIKYKVGLIITLIADEAADTPTTNGRYYPYFCLKEGQEETYENFKLTCSQLTLVNKTYETRRCIIQNTDKNASQRPFLISILSYRKWGDFKGVSDAMHIVSIYKSRMRLLKLEGTASQTTLIHCVAGIGRSGTLVSCINVLDYLENEGFPINVFAIAAKLRSERVGSIQGLQQYILIYLAVGQIVRKQFVNAAPQQQDPKSGFSRLSKLKSVPKNFAKRFSDSKQSSKR